MDIQSSFSRFLRDMNYSKGKNIEIPKWRCDIPQVFTRETNKRGWLKIFIKNLNLKDVTYLNINLGEVDEINWAYNAGYEELDRRIKQLEEEVFNKQIEIKQLKNHLEGAKERDEFNKEIDKETEEIERRAKSKSTKMPEK